MNNELNPIEEQCLDALLIETLADQTPPDLSRKILRRMAEEPVAGARSGKRSKKDSVSTVEPVRYRQKPVLVVVSLVATLAASVMFAVWLRSGEGDVGMEGLVTQDPSASTDPSSETPQITPPRQSPNDGMAPSGPPRGIPLAVQPNDGENDSLFPGPGEIEIQAPGPRQPVDAVTLVSAEVESEMEAYWRSVGIEPVADASDEEISARLAAVLGVTVPSGLIEDPQQLRQAFSNPRFSAAVARRWLNEISDGGLRRVSLEDRNRLVMELGKTLSRGSEFDLTLTRWINGESKNARAFYTATGSGRPDANDESAMVRRLASITMNVDLRCTRCHDALIHGRGQQDDYWQFTALVRHGIRRSDGKLEIDPDGKAPDVFYETPDGRQRIAEPEIPAGWLGRSDLPKIANVADWSKTLVGSEVLAKGVVNSLWQMVHGQPLSGRVIDPISAPHNDALDRLEANLVDDLIRSRFDVARTLTLVICAPVTSRGVPKALLPENVLLANEDETVRAMNAVNAFAGALPPRPRLSQGDRVAQVLQSVGARLNSEGQPVLAQIGENGDPNAKLEDVENLASDFPLRTGSVPVQWLNRINDFSSQVEHLAYLGGLSRVPKSVDQAAEVTCEVEDENTALHRTWWLVRP
ncbi:MAG: hypothetical protein AAGI63_03145 [Planctomycetota bacterium]